jgi:hypothetical protein
MKNYVLIFSLLVGMNMFASQNQRWNEDVIHNYKKFDFNRLSANEWRRTNIILGIQHRRKPAHYPKDRTPKKDRRKSV